MNLSEMTYEELSTLKEEVENMMQERRIAALEEMKAKMADMGISAVDFVHRMNGKPAYQNKDNPEETWSGKGRKPIWLMTKLNEGHSLQEFMVS